MDIRGQCNIGSFLGIKLKLKSQCLYQLSLLTSLRCCVLLHAFSVFMVIITFFFISVVMIWYVFWFTNIESLNHPFVLRFISSDHNKWCFHCNIGFDRIVWSNFHMCLSRTWCCSFPKFYLYLTLCRCNVGLIECI